MKIAAIHVDPQNGFTEICPQELPVTGALQILPHMNKMFEAADFNILSQDWHPKGAVYEATKEKPMGTKLEGYPNADITWNQHCVANTLGADVIDGLHRPEEYDLSIKKGEEVDCHPYGALWHDFARTRSTGIVEFLNKHKIKYVLVGGLALDFCVRLTVLELIEAGFIPALNLEATKPVFEAQAQSSIDEMAAAGAVVLETTQAMMQFVQEKK
ncbi:isochorismatase family protein [Photobacterium galatheae]|nr:isochorismatase family protein [Photobacterium galatheae]MCM0149052.1 isochorismatase family protein [Photobacterium galatheae]